MFKDIYVTRYDVIEIALGLLEIESILTWYHFHIVNLVSQRLINTTVNYSATSISLSYPIPIH